MFISVINQLDAQTLFHTKSYFMPLHVSSTCAHHQEVKIALHSLWYHHTCRWPSRARFTILSAASSRLNWRPPADLNRLVRFAERRNLVSALLPSHFKRRLQTWPRRDRYTCEERNVWYSCLPLTVLFCNLLPFKASLPYLIQPLLYLTIK